MELWQNACSELEKLQESERVGNTAASLGAIKHNDHLLMSRQDISSFKMHRSLEKKRK